MNSLLAAGIVPLAYIAGRCVVARCPAPGLRNSSLAQVALAVVAGVALLTPPLVLLAAAGLFWPRWLGAVGWVAAASALWLRRHATGQRLRGDAADAVVLLAAIVFALVAASARDETLGAGRDQQLYAESAVALSERGSSGVTFAPTDDADRKLLRAIDGSQIPGAVRGRNGVDLPVELTHPLAWPVWLAFAHSIFGIEGVYAANSAIFALGGLLFFALLRHITHPTIAAAATILLFALPSSLWISGISLSEPLAMTLLLAVPLLATCKQQRCRYFIGALLLAAVLVRIDAALAVLATMAAVLLASIAGSAAERMLEARRFALTQFVALAAGVATYVVLCPGYLQNKVPYVAGIAGAALVLVLTTTIITPHAAELVRRALDARAARCVAIAVIIGLFLYAVEVRPTLQPFSIIRHPSGLDGMRDLREESMTNLAVYLSWPLVIGALGGVCYGVWNRWATRPGLLRPLLLVLGIGPALLYLWFPLVSPDHPWAFRRFVPVIVPYAVAFAALFVHVCVRRAGRFRPAIGALAMLVPIPLLATSYPLDRVLLRENDGVTGQIDAIGRQLPPALVVAVEVDENIAASLLVAGGKPVALIHGDLSRPGDVEALTDWIRSKAQLGHSAWILHGPQFSRTGLRFTQERQWWVSRRALAPSLRPPATAMSTQNSKLILTRVDGFDPSFALHMFGSERAWGSPEAGFFDTEVTPFGMFRFTDGNAWIDVPASSLSGAEALKLDVFNYAKPGVQRHLQVIIDQDVAWQGSVAPAVQTLRIPVPRPLRGEVVRIGLASESVDPTEISPDDPRVGLSIGLIGIRPLRAGELAQSEPGISGFRCALSLVDLPPGSLFVSAEKEANFVLEVKNTGPAWWPVVRELGGAGGAVNIALRWHRHSDPASTVAENRWPLTVSMLSGDRTRIRVPLKPDGPDGGPLPPGEYEVQIGMVRDKVGAFPDGADAVVSIPVVVTP